MPFPRPVTHEELCFIMWVVDGYFHCVILVKTIHYTMFSLILNLLSRGKNHETFKHIEEIYSLLHT